MIAFCSWTSHSRDTLRQLVKGLDLRLTIGDGNRRMRQVGFSVYGSGKEVDKFVKRYRKAK